MFEAAIPEEAKAAVRLILPIVTEHGFYLAGGTGLALQIGHRISEDLDFFKPDPFDVNRLASVLRRESDHYEESIAEKDTLWAILNGVRCSFFYYAVPLLFPPISYEGLRVADWRDIVAEKFKTISQRGSKKDFFDLSAVFGSQKLSLDEAVSIFKKRFEGTGINNYHVLRSLVYFEDAEDDPDPVLLPGNNFNWDDVKSFFRNRAKEFETFFMR